MFALINQGQLYTDSAGYPVKIVRCLIRDNCIPTVPVTR
ncbi:DUF4222 domain-containing protein [Escherichia coli]|nr:DUF4222 domain-containing protein [Escherichia coli]EKF0051168.1 DUF4222 domain-containing protein [Escherichia coli]EKF0144855.1 DUF4222 domain-containing protein [Escherichia coli]EKH4359280.1 DUF4222 domain-containing protein [Escherichia coli]ELJ1447532.1 DUF4222 domain-containing protein [Escherichia coli]EMA0956283.1 DUF4222 domain-containing protein [Escherichia coli]